MNLIGLINDKHTKQRITDFKVGDTVRVHQKIIEGGKERIQVFEGVVIKTRAGKNINGTFTVRKISEGVGVERIYLVHSPKITRIEVVKRGKVRRANLSYLRNLRGKKARLKEKQFDSLIVNVAEESNFAEASLDKSEEISAPKKSVKISSDDKKESAEISGEQSEPDEETTEINPADEEDEEKLKEMSVEKVAELERKASEKAHRKEEEDIERDETEDVEEETDLGLEKAEDEDTRGQQEKPRKK